MVLPNSNRLNSALLLVAVLGLASGLVLFAVDKPHAATFAWRSGVAPVLVALIVEILRSLWRGEVGLDIVAALSMSAALFFGETLAASVVAVMYSGGAFLESFAEGRARREMSALLSRVPRTATKHANGTLVDIELDNVVPDDLLLIHQGAVVPADGEIASEQAILDKSALTGESMPVRLGRGDEALSGSINAGEAFDLRVRHRADDSTYAGIVRLVEAAQASKAPMARLAERYSMLFLAVTLALATGAWWFTGDPVRAVAVLVVATPCPLILAVPVALVAGLSRAAHFGVLIKGAKPLETLAGIKTLVLDKTGTLTDGRPQIISVEIFNGMSHDEVLQLLAALEQASKHPMARAIVAAARQRGLVLPAPQHVVEHPGEGIVGTVSGRQVSVGGVAFINEQLAATAAASPMMNVGTVVVALAIDNKIAAHITMADALRTGTTELLAALRKLGIGRIVLATGDRRAVAENVTKGLGLDAVNSELTPEQKVHLVLAERKHGPVMMVGDGVNDAPALAAADIGVAMGARGAAASAEAADIVLLLDHLDCLLPGIEIAKRSQRVVMESVVAGIGMSIVGMVAAALGYLTPVEGAVVQELIDVAVIMNALRVLAIKPRIGKEEYRPKA